MAAGCDEAVDLRKRRRLAFAEISPEDAALLDDGIGALPDAVATLATLNASSYRKQYEHPLEIRIGTNRKRQLNIFDPDGTRTEVMEPVTIDGKPAPSSNAPFPQ